MWIRRGVVLVATLLLLGGRSLADPGEPTPATGAGMTIYRDPTTGRLAPPPPDVAAQLQPRAAVRPTPMVERLGMSPGGGVLLDGIPRMGVTVRVEPTGTVSTHCDREPRGAVQ